jgi:hypothetical protein
LQDRTRPKTEAGRWVPRSVSSRLFPGMIRHTVSDIGVSTGCFEMPLEGSLARGWVAAQAGWRDGAKSKLCGLIKRPLV